MATETQEIKTIDKMVALMPFLEAIGENPLEFTVVEAIQILAAIEDKIKIIKLVHLKYKKP
jgi:hypothetical protein